MKESFCSVYDEVGVFSGKFNLKKERGRKMGRSMGCNCRGGWLSFFKEIEIYRYSGKEIPGNINSLVARVFQSNTRSCAFMETGNLDATSGLVLLTQISTSYIPFYFSKYSFSDTQITFNFSVEPL